MNNMKTFIQIAALLMAILSGTSCTGAPPDQAPAEDFQKYYSNTRWYFSRYQAAPSEWNEVTVADNHGMQAFLTSTSGLFMIYGEREPSNFIKAFYGNGTLKRLSGVSEPIFERDCDYTQRNPRKILLIGFVAARAFDLEATHSETNRTMVLQEALSVAQKAYQQLLTKGPEDKGSSNQAPQAIGAPRLSMMTDVAWIKIEGLITDLIFICGVGALVGILVGRAFRDRISPVWTTLAITCLCALVLAAAWFIFLGLGLGGWGFHSYYAFFIGYVCLLSVPFYTCFSGLVPNIVGAFLIQTALMSLMGNLLWWGLKARRLKMDANKPSVNGDVGH